MLAIRRLPDTVLWPQMEFPRFCQLVDHPSQPMT
jgi:hypothetical protein